MDRSVVCCSTCWRGPMERTTVAFIATLGYHVAKKESKYTPDWVNTVQAKPLSEVFDMTAFSKPQNMNEIVSRLRNNVSYFKTNYAIVAMGTTALLMLMNPSSLIVLGLLALVWFYMYIIKTSALVLGGREFSEREKFWLLSGGSVFVIFFLTSVGATIFYALGLSMIMIAAHGSLRIPDDTTLFADEVPTESSSLTGLLSMFRPKTTLSEFTSSV